MLVVAPMTPARGRTKWRQLHDFTEAYPDIATEADVLRAWAWLEAWEHSLGSMGCTCRSEWYKIRRLHPPSLGGRAEFVRWGIDRHNDVNQLLKRPQWVETNN